MLYSRIQTAGTVSRYVLFVYINTSVSTRKTSALEHHKIIVFYGQIIRSLLLFCQLNTTIKPKSYIYLCLSSCTQLKFNILLYSNLHKTYYQSLKNVDYYYYKVNLVPLLHRANTTTECKHALSNLSGSMTSNRSQTETKNFHSLSKLH